MTDERPSKSARKREAHAIRALADELVALKSAQIDQVIDNADIARAVREAQTMASHGALRRQKQYIARLMREHDLEPIQAGLRLLAGDPAKEKQRFKRAEQLRDTLLQADTREREALLTEAGISGDQTMMAEIDDCIHQANTTQDATQRKSAGRQLFRILHAALS